MVELNNLPTAIQEVLEACVNDMKLKYNPLGVLLVGSYAKGYAGPNSDLDIHIVVEDQDWRERGNFWMQGYEIEYFINPVKQIKAYLRTEDVLRPNTADMFATGIVLFSRDPVITELVKLSKEKLYTKSNPPKGVELELMRYSVDNARKDLLDLQDDTASYAYQQTLWETINLSKNIILRYNGTYQKRLKVVVDQLKQIDTEFVKLLELLIKDPFNLQPVLDLLEYVENLIGAMPREWKLRGELRDI